MFTGIIEELGTIKKLNIHNKTLDITVECSKVLEHTKIGDSIAINGCCQTVVDYTTSTFSVNVSEETLNITTLGELKQGAVVNLERALTPSSRLGGHIVQGHIDGTAIFTKSEKYSNFYNLYFKVAPTINRYIVKKGSIAIDGISLTVAEIENDTIKIAVIPHTYANTNLKNLNIGDIVNIETDILGRYIEKFLSQENNINTQKIDENFLKENGFM